MDIPRQQTALLVIDMQNSFLDAKGSMAAVGLPRDMLLQRASRMRSSCGRSPRSERASHLHTLRVHVGLQRWRPAAK